MEGLTLQEKIRAFLTKEPGSGYGSGYGDGDGYGSGYGDGYGIKSVNGELVHEVDGVPTIIRSVHAGIAKGAILESDLTLTPCYIVKQNGLFAHGKDLREAQAALLDKLFDDMPEEERIAAFVAAHESGQTYTVQDFFDWHHRLTGSCQAGRESFRKSHGLAMCDTLTVQQFIDLTQDSYGGSVIRKLRPHYEED